MPETYENVEDLELAYARFDELLRKAPDHVNYASVFRELDAAVTGVQRLWEKLAANPRGPKGEATVEEFGMILYVPRLGAALIALRDYAQLRASVGPSPTAINDALRAVVETQAAMLDAASQTGRIPQQTKRGLGCAPAAVFAFAAVVLAGLTQT
jgi:hypothetical protein